MYFFTPIPPLEGFSSLLLLGAWFGVANIDNLLPSYSPPRKPFTPYDENGYDYAGYNRAGFSRKGLDREGYDRDGFDLCGYNRKGYNRAGLKRGEKAPEKKEDLSRTFIM